MAAYNEQAFAAGVYNFMAAAYRTGLLEKMARIQGEVIDEVMQEQGVSMSDLVNKIDSIQEETVMRFEKTIIRVRFLLPLMADGRIFSVVSRILEYRWAQGLFKKSMKLIYSGSLTPSNLKQKVATMAGKTAQNLKIVSNKHC